MNRLIGMSGYSESGKDTAASLLVKPAEAGGMGFQRVTLADPVRELLEEIGDRVYLTDFMEGSYVTLSQAVHMSGWDVVKRDSKQARQLMVNFANGARDLMGPDIWIRTALLHNPFMLQDELNYCVTDIRFPNEIRWIKDLGGTLLWVERPGVNGNPNVSGENGFPRHYADHIILNDGTIDDLHDKVRAILKASA